MSPDAEVSIAPPAPITSSAAITPPAPITPSAAAKRMRNHRERRRLGLRSVTVELRETEIDVLIQKGLLKPDARNGTYDVRDALHAYL
jgi:hypothetical protein